MKTLKGLLGKRVIWVWHDEEDDKDYLFFHDLTAICIEGGSSNILVDGRSLAATILSEHFQSASEIFKLKEILVQHSQTLRKDTNDECDRTTEQEDSAPTVEGTGGQETTA
jgi:hypothetical protein